MKQIFEKLTLILILLSVFLPKANAQKVGVVLSGGGAKGLYHIGILKALEDNDIPIDYIAGTSMGSIVGGMYASGMSPDEMLTIFRSNEISVWLSGKIEDRYQYFYKKPDPNGSMVSFDVNLKKIMERKRNPNLQDNDDRAAIINFNEQRAAHFSSLISSVQLDLAMLKYFSSPTAAARNNFDSLFVPFRCVSVNIIRREEYLWKNGDLGKAIRSSMAIPLVFKPIIVDSMMMYDGGILNNFPWKELNADFNPDVIIGGICTGGKIDPSSITGQIELLTMSKTDYNLPDSVGVKISRNVDIGMLDYAKVDYAVALGYEDAMKLIPQIKERVKRRVSGEDIASRRLKFQEKCPSLIFDDIDIMGLTPHQVEYVESQLQIDRNKAIDFESFKSEYFKIVSGGMVDGDFPTAIYNPETGYYKINMSMTARSSFKAMAGVNISSANINEGYLSFQYSKTGRISSTQTLSGYLGNFYSSANFSTRYNFYGRRQPFYISSNLNYSFFDYGRGNNQRYSYGNRAFDYSRLNGYYFDAAIGMPVERLSKLELRYAMGRDIYKFDPINMSMPNLSPHKSNFGYITANLSLSRNSLNYTTYPIRGLQQSITALITYSDEKFRHGLTVGGLTPPNVKRKDLWFGGSFYRDDYYPVVNHFSIGYTLQAIYTNMPSQANEYGTKLIAPGFYPTEHSKTLFLPDFHNASFAAVGIKPTIEWNDNIYLKTEAFVYFPDLTNYKAISDRLKYIISSSIVYQSPIGPVSLNYSHYDIKGMAKDYFTFNIGLIMFNKRGIKYF
ncbi:MAG: patatin-like phospholipase family protein [Rikenellaceae bacterium]